VLDSRIRGLWDRLMRPVGRALGRTGISPNAITFTGVALQAWAAVLIVTDHLLSAGLVAGVAAIADTLDGAVARGRGLISDFGALLDSTLDRLSDALFFIPVAWLYAVGAPNRPPERWVAAVALVTLVASFLVSYVKARAEGLGFECNIGIVERAERVIIMILGLLLNLLPLMVAILAGLSTITFVQRLMYVRARIRTPTEPTDVGVG
jgi:CDP-diacylglycerol---glycerol-3-phosphate 3-phosphatidyltransferase